MNKEQWEAIEGAALRKAKTVKSPQEKIEQLKIAGFARKNILEIEKSELDARKFEESLKGEDPEAVKKKNRKEMVLKIVEKTFDVTEKVITAAAIPVGIILLKYNLGNKQIDRICRIEEIDTPTTSPGKTVFRQNIDEYKM